MVRRLDRRKKYLLSRGKCKLTLIKWRSFLLGKHFIVYTDHKGLTFFKTQADLNRRQRRWQEILADYDYTIEYKPGKQNQVADALSRIRIDVINPVQNEDILEVLKNEYKKDQMISKIKLPL